MNSLLLYLVVGVLVVFAISFMGMYNRLIALRSQLERAWSNIDVILKQRYDEIPQLIQVIEQYASYESGLLKALADARSHYGSATSVDDKIRASREISMAFKGVMSIGENYPALKTNEGFLQLQNRISALENTISDRRESYNECVANFNTRIEQFPSSLAAGMLNYRRQTLFEASANERTAPNLKINLPKMGA